MAKVNAASRLREQVLAVDNTVLLTAAGRPDRVIRFNRRPEILGKYRFDKARETSNILTDISTPYTVLNMDRGPDSEAWTNIMREVNQTSRRDRPVPEPLQVAEDCHEEWSVAPEDVPVIELNHIVEVVSSPVNDSVKTEVKKEEPRFKKDHVTHRGPHGKKCFEEVVNA